MADALAGHVMRERPALVVLGTRADTGLRRLMLGSVAADIVYQSPVPALVVPTRFGRRHEAAQGTPGGAGISR